MTEEELINKIEWVNKRSSLRDEPLTRIQKELLMFVFADNVVNKKVNRLPKLELKHLAPYLPYGLKVSETHFLSIGKGIGSIDHLLTTKSKQYKPLLKPLSNLTRGELEKQGYWHHIDWLTYELQTSKRNNGIKGLEKHINNTPYEMICYLFSQHYDVFGLIEKGLAIDVNTL